MNHKGKYR